MKKNISISVFMLLGWVAFAQQDGVAPSSTAPAKHPQTATRTVGNTSGAVSSHRAAVNPRHQRPAGVPTSTEISATRKASNK
jgi:hypothetical protein